MAHKSSNPGSASAPGAGSNPAGTSATGTGSNSAGSNAAGSTSNPTGTGLPAGTAGSAGAGTAGSGGSTAAGSVTGVANPGLSAAGVTSPKKHGLEGKIEKRLHGLENFLTPDVSLVINGQSFTVAGLIQSLSAMDDLFTALTAVEEKAKVDVTQARQAINAEAPAIEALIVGLDNTLRGFFGKGNPVLANFGIASGARRKKATGVELAKKSGTALLTREARHTMGKKERLLVNGGEATVTRARPDGTAIEGGGAPASPAATGPANGGSVAK